MTASDFLTNKVSDPDVARRFLQQLAEKHPIQSAALNKNNALLSDVLTLVSCSPLFAATLLHDPEHIAWLGRERVDTRVRDKQALLESLARFSLTHSQIEPQVALTRFRRRELMRIFLRDIRRLATVAEITEEISNLADAILEHALRLSKQDLDNRFGPPQEEDERSRFRPAQFCVVSLGKLGSKELNYSSDIDLLFIFSENGKTSGSGTRGIATNLEYFSKLSEAIIRLVGGQGGEGSAYRVDLRLRPNGRVGLLALPLADTVRYYQNDAAAWERQVLIRSRASAGSERLFRDFFAAVEDRVFSSEVSVETALENVSLSKQKIDLRNNADRGVDIKLGRGGIREIEFIAQALQLAHGGQDEWLRAPHTLISLDRLEDRGYVTSQELAKLFEAYDFLRRLEHILQIENGLQTHTVPADTAKRQLLASRLGGELRKLDAEILNHTENVSRIFRRIFEVPSRVAEARPPEITPETDKETPDPIIERIKSHAPRFLEVLKAHPKAIKNIADICENFPERNYNRIVETAVGRASDLGGKLREFRQAWYRQLIEIVVFDAFDKLELPDCKRRQTALAEASVEIALQIAVAETEKRYKAILGRLPIGVLALGKSGSGSLDYDSDLDLVFVIGDESSRPKDIIVARQNLAEMASRIVETFTTVLSSVTRDGHLYRVDLRLRPHGSDGPLVTSLSSIREYFKNEAAIWELLAFVKLRAIGGDMEFAVRVENEIRTIIHERALSIDAALLASETRAVRDKLERPRTGPRTKNIDIKFAPGGLLDIYFASRYLQLRFDVRDKNQTRSTADILEQLCRTSIEGIEIDSLYSLRNGYEFLSRLDHFVRLYHGRTRYLSRSVLERMSASFSKPHYSELLEERLTITRLEIRAAFDRITTVE